MSRRLLMCGLALSATLVLVPAAWSQESSISGYGGSGGTVQSDVQQGVGDARQVGDPGDPAAQRSDPDSLPFTGLDIGLLIGGGVLLLGTGATLHVVRRRIA